MTTVPTQPSPFVKVLVCILVYMAGVCSLSLILPDFTPSLRFWRDSGKIVSGINDPNLVTFTILTITILPCISTVVAIVISCIKDPEFANRGILKTYSLKRILLSIIAPAFIITHSSYFIIGNPTPVESIKPSLAGLTLGTKIEDSANEEWVYNVNFGGINYQYTGDYTDLKTTLGKPEYGLSFEPLTQGDIRMETFVASLPESHEVFMIETQFAGTETEIDALLDETISNYTALYGEPLHSLLAHYYWTDKNGLILRVSNTNSTLDVTLIDESKSESFSEITAQLKAAESSSSQSAASESALRMVDILNKP